MNYDVIIYAAINGINFLLFFMMFILRNQTIVLRNVINGRREIGEKKNI